MRNVNNSYNTSSSLFSLEYKIPYDDRPQSIAEHLQESQSELNFLKIKLTEAYQKLQFEINTNSQLQDLTNDLSCKLEQISNALELQRKQNNKLKQVLQKVLENRKMLEKDFETINSDWQKKMKIKNQQIEEINKKNKIQLEDIKRQHQRQIQQIYDTHRKQFRMESRSIQKKYQQQIQILERQIQKITQEKVAQVTRLRHQVQCYQNNTYLSIENSLKQKNINKNNNSIRTKRQRQFRQYQNNQPKQFTQNQQGSNQNINHLQDQIEHSNVGKWKKSQASQTIGTSKGDSTDDQQLSKCQLKRKKAQFQLNKLQRIKRPSQLDRIKIQELQKQIYQLDSTISGLKRKIRQKY